MERHIVNIVEILQNHLTGEVCKELGGMVGANESDMGKIIAAGLPSVLSGLGAVASSKSGADKLSKTIGEMDSSIFADLGKMLGSTAMSGGGRMLESLLGSGVVDGLTGVISKFTGVKSTIVKTALGYLAPIVLGAIGASFKGDTPEGAGISKLFSEQKNNITSAMPSGLSVNSVPGFQGLASAGIGSSNDLQEPSGIFGKLLVPSAVIAALIVAGVFLMDNGKKPDNAAKDVAVGAVKPTTEKVEDTSKAVKKTVGEVAAQSKSKIDGADMDTMKTNLTGIMDGLFASLEGIKDANSAEAALPSLKETTSKIDLFGKGVSVLSSEQKTAIGTLIQSQLGKLNLMFEMISALPGIEDTFKQILLQLKGKILSIVG